MAPPDAPEAFDLATDETRAAILRALAAAHREHPRDPWLSYSALRERAGVRDKGNFNYHLDRLDDLVVHGEDGYRINAVGMDLVTLVAAQAFDADWSWGPDAVDGTCRLCGEGYDLRYEDGLFRLDCGDPDHAMAFPGHPALAADHDAATAARVASLLTLQEVDLLVDGVCPACHGAVVTTVDHEAYGVDHWHLHAECDRCGIHLGYPVGLRALCEPRVQGALAEAGIDVRERPFWTFDWCTQRAETVVSEDPLRLRIDVPASDPPIAVVIDGDGEVVTIERA